MYSTVSNLIMPLLSWHGCLSTIDEQLLDDNIKSRYDMGLILYKMPTAILEEARYQKDS